MNLQQIWQWSVANPFIVGGIVCWLVANVAPRPHPALQESRGRKFFWTLIDRISVLTAETVPGKLKWILKASPLPAIADRITHPDLEPVVVTSDDIDEPTDKLPPETGSQ